MEASDDVKAMREALSAALEQVNKVYDILSRPCVFIEEARQGCREARGVLIPALAAPPRNCDVGTEVEKHRRFIRYCNACDCPMGCIHRKQFVGMLDERCASMLKCYIRWEQMPYKEGDTK